METNKLLEELNNKLKSLFKRMDFGEEIKYKFNDEDDYEETLKKIEDFQRKKHKNRFEKYNEWSSEYNFISNEYGDIIYEDEIFPLIERITDKLYSMNEILLGYQKYLDTSVRNEIEQMLDDYLYDREQLFK
jgi:hypothetical protein